MQMRVFLASVLCFLIVSCDNTSTGKKNLLNEIIKTENGIFRGAELGNNPEAIKALETTGLTEEYPDYLFYEFTIDSSNSFTISYSFESNELNEIRADIYVQSDTIAKELCNNFVEYFNQKYEQPTEADHFFWAWPTLYKNIPMRIELSDESADYNHVGKLSLVIYKEPEMAM